MKKLISLAVLALVLLPTAGMADSTEAGQKATLSGNNSFLGSVTATNLNPVFVSNNPGNGMAIPLFTGFPAVDFQFIINTNLSLNAAIVNQTTPPTTFAAIQITGFSIECLPYIPAQAVLGAPGYPYNVETTGFGGGTVTIREYKLVGSPVVVGTVVLPDSPHGGPYVNTAISKLPAPYTPTGGSIFTAVPTSSGFAQTFAYQDCYVTAVLQ